MLLLGVDLAWGASGPTPRESGLVALLPDGRVVDATWARPLSDVAAWLRARAGDGPACAFVDAPLVVTNPAGTMRACERQVGRAYGRARVSAHASSLGRGDLAGVALRQRLEAAGWTYEDGRAGPPDGGRVLSECYPHTTLVGVPALGQDVRPAYKRRPAGVPLPRWRAERAATCDALLRGLDGALHDADPPLRLRSHPRTARLLDEPSPLDDRAYKHREDLLDAALCAWTASLWLRHGLGACQVLGPGVHDEPGTRAATIVCPARAEQRLARPTDAAQGCRAAVISSTKP